MTAIAPSRSQPIVDKTGKGTDRLHAFLEEIQGIAFSATGPQGAQGEQGPQGVQGPAGTGGGGIVVVPDEESFDFDLGL